MKILGHKYECVLRGERDISENICGSTSADRQQISVAHRLKKSDQDAVLMHEIIEALNYRLELELPHAKITTLGEGLYQVLADNGMKTDWRKVMRSNGKRK